MPYPLRLFTSRAAGSLARALAGAGVDPAGIEILAPKADLLVLRVDGVGAPAANILKQQLLSIGGDAAVHREAIRGAPAESTVYLIADRSRFGRLPEKLARQPFGLAGLGEAIGRLLAATAARPARLSLPGGALDLGTPVVMGVLNVTPDSFSDGGSWTDPGAAAERARAMVAEGAGLVDIGGESTRPGAAEVPPGDELARVRPVLERLGGSLGVPISIDTRHASVARAAVDLGASIVNDVSGLTHDPAMTEAVRATKAAVVVMHMRGTPATMQIDPRYGDVTGEILSWLEARAAGLLRAGIDRGKIVVDPGIGFGKRLEDNLRLFDGIGDFAGLGFPVMVGGSRKRFIGDVTGRAPAGRLAGGLAAVAKCLAGGVRILRVHDVAETVDFVKVWRAIEEAKADS